MTKNQDTTNRWEVEGIANSSKFPVSFAIIELVRFHRTMASDLLREIGLFPGQELLLMQLWHTDNQSQKSLGNSLGINHTTVTKSVQRLEEAGLVTRKRSDLDKRVTLVSLTQAGMDLKEDVFNIWRTLESTVTENLSDEEKSVFLDLVKRILNKG
ncbi:MarR family transcriptional regulator [Bacillus sp. sid0103]|uniref:MarR family winged helix-turn-helix transcriptional regulator n=1 Tax=Bacillus sp. sid0103 TaxID=2856337 RepID=UPI001C487CDA|nr:MarR family transcriptional regulator [Bacillus sp. sid0103]MBV7509534.1 MarR family transcriptional regulator [Bacillus sp. sid0103]